MKITVEHCDAPENEVILRCPSLDDEMLRVLSLLQSSLQKLCAWDEHQVTHLLDPNNVLYCESIEEKTFLYCTDSFHRSALSLAELETRYEQAGFLRISKSAVVNLHRIQDLQSRPAGRIEATLQNGERLVISRHYAPMLRERLGL